MIGIWGLGFGVWGFWFVRCLSFGVENSGFELRV